ncbi:MAG: exodeoxyribonuclease V subunit beta [Methylococcales bacterium]|nr:exodeoxyribonuclease V subunit beta [Methylococcales bacterium]
MSKTRFEVTREVLLPGINLIEANAGTGKTYTIAMLFLRFIVEHGFLIDQLLVVTFTHAAAAELKERIRLRLSEIYHCISVEKTGLDDTTSQWLQGLELEESVVLQRLKTALLDLDQSAVFTIHGFCYKTLQEFAVESKQLFELDLIGDSRSIRQQLADDFWRQTIYPLAPHEGAILTAQYDNPTALLASINGVGGGVTVYPETQSLTACLTQVRAAKDELKCQFELYLHTLSEAVTQPFFKKTFQAQFLSSHKAIQQWLTTERLTFPLEALNTLSYQGVLEGLNGQKFRTTKTQIGLDRKIDYVADLGIHFGAVEKVIETSEFAHITLRGLLLAYIRNKEDAVLEQIQSASFDCLIGRLANLMVQADGITLKKALQKRYQVALIDEFQDTDQQQWTIFSQLFAQEKHFLYLIGDPKQAIYKFRGADVFSYFNAAKLAHRQYTLTDNWRSSPRMVGAVNTIFESQDNVFLLNGLSYQSCQTALSDVANCFKSGGHRLPGMVLWQLGCNAENSSGFLKSTNAQMQISVAVVNEIIDLLTPGNAFEKSIEGLTTAIAPKDIAILVRSNAQAIDYQNLLREVGVPSVLNSAKSVFETTEANEFYLILQAIAQPNNTVLLKQFLTVAWLNVSAPELISIVENDGLLGQWSSRLSEYYLIWKKQGLLAMTYKLLAIEEVACKLSSCSAFERKMSNIFQLAELVQTAETQENLNINGTLDWLQRSIADLKYSEQELLRLESDEQAINILTVHRSKGLEFSVVFCPVLWQHNQHVQKENSVIQCHENDLMVADLGSSKFEDRKQLALQESFAEDVRLSYVAMTRAKLRCYIGWANVRTKENSNRSALAWLLFDAPVNNSALSDDFSRQQGDLQALVSQHSRFFEYHLLPADQSVSHLRSIKKTPLLIAPEKCLRDLKTLWQINSYTGLATLSIDEANEGKRDDSEDGSIEGLVTPVVDQLPKGSRLGNVVHELLEKNAFSELAKHGDSSFKVDQVCARFGLKLDRPALMTDLLQQVVSTPLNEQDHEFYLAQIDNQHCIKEMPFYLSHAQINTQQINIILGNEVTYRSLTPKNLVGYMTGFIDLVCLHQGKYYLMDYKSNYLDDYSSAGMIEAMRTHNYGLQAWLYSVALTNFLQEKVPEYNYRSHFGGVLYLFVRGMEPDRPGSGVYSFLPDADKLQQLTRLFADG